MFSNALVGRSLLVLCTSVTAVSLGACQKTPQSQSQPQAQGQASAVGAINSASPQPTQPSLIALNSELPDVSAVQQDGSTVRLRDFKGKPVVVYFYPKDDTTGCTIEAKGIRDLYEDLKATSAVVIGVSSDDRDSHVAFTSKYQLPFILLDDSSHAVENAFGVPLSSGHAARVTFVFDATGKLRKVFPHVDPTGHAAEILGVLKTMG